MDIRYYTGIPAGEASMPTCGRCNRQITRDEQYAGVLIQETGVREARHTGECETWSAGPASLLRVGDLIYSHRYMLTEWGGRITARITARAEELDADGWRVYDVVPADAAGLTALINELKTHPEEWMQKLAQGLSPDMSTVRVRISDGERTYYKRGV